MSKKGPSPQPAALRKKAERELTEILTRTVMNGPSAVMITRNDGTIEYVNRKFSTLTGYAPAEVIGQKASVLKSGFMPATYYRKLWLRLEKGEEWAGEFHNRKKNGEPYWESASICPVCDTEGHIRHYLKIAEDITERKRLESKLRTSVKTLQANEAHLQATCRQLEVMTQALKRSKQKLQRMSQEDALTGLLNRRGLDTALLRAKTLAERQGYGIGFLVIDIDHFKQINDQYGHATGDRILTAHAALLRSHLRASDLICRHGGDEIVIVLPSADAETTRRTAERLLVAVRQHDFSEGAAGLSVTVSIGAAYGMPVPGQSLEHLMIQADRALYRAKNGGRNRIAFGTGDGEKGIALSDAPTPDAAGEQQNQQNRERHALLLSLLDVHDLATGTHSRRVAQIAATLAQAVGLPAGKIDLITQSALLHDIGKIAIPDAILLKPGALTAAERSVVQGHSRIGYDLLQMNPHLKALSEAVLSHHERLDGSGYPRGLKGKRIGISARILAVADTYDTLRAGRPYAKPCTAEATLREIKRCRRTLFDPAIADALIRCQDALELAVYSRHPS